MHYHLIGIGGIGMSGIAQLLLKRGIAVSGSDLKDSAITQELKKAGADIFIGHRAQNLDGADLVVVSSAIDQNNPEIRAAAGKNIPVIKRAQALAELMRNETVITVTGSHGKTTTTTLSAYLLMRAGFSPTVAAGGFLRNIDNNALTGRGSFFVAEADESDGSFLYYQPHFSIITNIDHEHLDYYKNFDNAVAAYAQFLNRTDTDGCVFCCNDDPQLRAILEGYANKRVLFGLLPGADIYPKNIRFRGLASEFDCFYREKFVERFTMNLAGMHNISNSLSVIALGLEMGIDLGLIKSALQEFQGARRRIEVKLDDQGLLVIDDYAHHPTEIKATLAAVDSLGRRVIAVFQPHRYSRTRLLLDEFADAFKKADCVVITDIYGAGEAPIEGVTSGAIFDKIKDTDKDKEIYFLPQEEIVAHLLSMVRPNDLVITLGAGDIYKVGDELVERLKNKDRSATPS